MRRDSQENFDQAEYPIVFKQISEREREVAQSCPTLCDPMDCSLPGSYVHGIFQAMVLEWIAISYSKGSSQPRDRTPVSCIIDRCFIIWATREVSEWGADVHSAELLNSYPKCQKQCHTPHLAKRQFINGY